VSSKLRVEQGKEADLCSFQLLGIRLSAHCFFLFQFVVSEFKKYEGWNFNSGNYLFTTDTK